MGIAPDMSNEEAFAIYTRINTEVKARLKVIDQILTERGHAGK